jgi:hypothetical protein
VGPSVAAIARAEGFIGGGGRRNAGSRESPTRKRASAKLERMAQTTAEARQQVLEATDDLGAALALLSEAYERLDEHSADLLEQDLFRPVRTAYGRARRTHAEFAARFGLPGQTPAPAPLGAPSRSVKDLVGDAVDATSRAGSTLATLQDSMLPVEVGTPELRAGLAEVRRLLDHVRLRARELIRTLGR